MKSASFYCFIVSLSLGLIACDKDDKESSKDSRRVIYQMDISSSSALIVKEPTSSLRSTSQTENKLYKLTKDGLLLEVIYKDSNGNIIQSQNYSPLRVYDTPINFVIVEYDSPHQYIIVNKQTGLAHLLWDDSNNNGWTYLGPYGEIDRNEVPFETDNFGNLYMVISSNMDGIGSVYKLNVSDMTLELLTPPIYNVGRFWVNAAGDIAFGNMYRTTKGNFYKYEEGNILTYWNGPSNKIFAICDRITGYQGDALLRTISILRFDVDQSSVVPVLIPVEEFILNEFYTALFIQYQRVKFKNGREYAYTDYSGNTFLFCLSDGVPSNYTMANGSIEDVFAPPPSAPFIHYYAKYDNSKLFLVAWLPNDFNKRYIYWTQPSNTDINKCSISKDGTALISLFDRASAMYKLYKVGSDGSIQELNSESFSKITSLAALN